MRRSPWPGLLVRLQHRRQVAAFYRQFIEPGDLCFDVGANVGERTRVLLGLGARVIAVDPHPQCVETLHRIGSDRLVVVAAAVGAAEGTAVFRPASATTISSMSPEWISSVKESGRFADQEWSDPIDVPTTTLDALITKYGAPAFCKIDVEGYERQVIAGLSQPLGLLSFEFVPEYAVAAFEAIERLDALGMRSFNFSEGESQRFESSEWQPADELRARLVRMRAPQFGDVYARQPIVNPQ